MIGDSKIKLVWPTILKEDFCKNYDIYFYLQMITVNTNCIGRALDHHIG